MNRHQYLSALLFWPTPQTNRGSIIWRCAHVLVNVRQQRVEGAQGHRELYTSPKEGVYASTKRLDYLPTLPLNAGNRQYFLKRLVPGCYGNSILDTTENLGPSAVERKGEGACESVKSASDETLRSYSPAYDWLLSVM